YANPQRARNFCPDEGVPLPASSSPRPAPRQRSPYRAPLGGCPAALCDPDERKASGGVLIAYTVIVKGRRCTPLSIEIRYLLRHIDERTRNGSDARAGRGSETA